ncbi:MAG: restriction endonuclease subunit S [Nitrosomonas sp.]|nr:restriction endonuclease subunit S [Nitrosomonas sp.]
MKVPKLRFKDFSDDWTKNTIQFFINNKFIISHLDGNHGALYPKNHEFSATGVPYITANDFVTGNVDFRKCKFLPEVKAKKFKKGIAIDGDVLFAHNATVGPCAILRTDLSFVVLSTSATYFRCDLKKINNYFLLYSFQSDFFVSQYRSIMSQTTRNQVPITSQRKLLVALPSLPEQTKIANFLTAIDEKITQFTQKCDLLAQYKKGVMQQIFSQKLRFKDDDGREFPEWEETALGDIAHIKTGSKDLIDKEDEGIYPFFVRAQKIERINSYSYDGEAILIPGDGVNVGKVYHYVNGRFDYHQRVYKISDYKNAEAKYIFFYMNQYFDKHAMSFNSKASVDSLRLPIIQKFKIQLPTKLEQTKIANFLTAIDDKITQAQTQLEAVKHYKKGLLQQLFV